MQKIWKKRIIQIGIVTALFFCLLLHREYVVQADTDETTIASVIGNFPDLFETNSTGNDVLRTITWTFICILKALADAAGSLYQNTLGLLDLTTTMTNESIIGQYKELFTAILAVSIMVLGILLIIRGENRTNLLGSLFLIVLAFATPTWILLNLSGPVKNACLEIAGNNTITNTVINSHLYDLFYIDNRVGLASLTNSNFQLEDYHAPDANFDIDKIKINETMNYERDGLSEAASGQDGILGQQLSWVVDESGNYTYELSDIYNGFGWNSEDSDDWFNEFYYRYQYDGMEIMLTMIALIFVYSCVSYKVVRMVLEIITSKLFVVFYSANLNAEQKTVQILKHIINCYVILLSSSILIKVFTLGENYISEQTDGLTYCLILIMWAFAIIDGPNILQQITGVDAGLSSLFGKAASAYYTGRMAVAAAKGVTGGIGKIVGREGSSDSGSAQNGNNNSSMEQKDKMNEQKGATSRQGSALGYTSGSSAAMGGKDSTTPPGSSSTASAKYQEGNTQATTEGSSLVSGSSQVAQNTSLNPHQSSMNTAESTNTVMNQETGDGKESQIPEMPLEYMPPQNPEAFGTGMDSTETPGATQEADRGSALDEQGTSGQERGDSQDPSGYGVTAEKESTSPSGFNIPQMIDLGQSEATMYKTPTENAEGMDEALKQHRSGEEREINGISEIGKKDITTEYKGKKG